MASTQPTFRDLTPDECHRLLARHNVGRLALTHQNRVDIFPIHYVHDDGWLYCRTAVGTKIEMAAHNRWVAFEVDEVRGTFDWESVVVKGGLYLLRHEGSEEERALYDRGVSFVRRIVPEAFTPNDPLVDRAILFRIHIDEMTGRGAATA